MMSSEKKRKKKDAYVWVQNYKHILLMYIYIIRKLLSQRCLPFDYIEESNNKIDGYIDSRRTENTNSIMIRQ